MSPRALSVAIRAVALLLATASLAACSAALPGTSGPGPVQGEGDLVTEDRTSGDVERVSVGDGMTVAILTGEPVEVAVTAQPNLLALVRTELIDGQLVVNIESPGISSTEPVTLTVVAPAIRSVALSGGAYGAMDTQGDTLLVDVSGGAVIEATGNTGSLDLTASTGARAKLGKLVAETATVTMSGGAEAELNVVSTLTGSAASGATIHLAGTPATVDVSTGSGGMVIDGPAPSG